MPEQNEITNLEQLKKDYANVFGSEAGKRVLEDLEKKCFINSTTFSDTPEKTIFYEGMRCVYLHIKMMMTLDIDKLKRINYAGP